MGAGSPELWNLCEGSIPSYCLYCEGPGWLKMIAVSAWEDTVGLDVFFTPICNASPFLSEDQMVSFTKHWPIFHRSLRPLAHGLLLLLFLLGLKQDIVTAGARTKEALEKSWRNIFKVYLAWTHQSISRVENGLFRQIYLWPVKLFWKRRKTMKEDWLF